MATWLEIRCEKRGAGRSGDTRCWSDDNAGPSGMAADDQQSVIELMRELHAEAKREGWTRPREGWVCPCCTKQAALAPKTVAAAIR